MAVPRVYSLLSVLYLVFTVLLVVVPSSRGLVLNSNHHAHSSAAFHSTAISNGTFAMRYTLNLDLPPEERWVEICSKYIGYSDRIMKYFSTIATPAETAILQAIGGKLELILGDYGKEIEGIAKTMNIPLGVMVVLNFSYELRKLGGPHSNTTIGACTSIVSQNTDGRVMHGRNLDWGVPDYLKDLIFDVDFQQGNKTVFSGTMFLGYVGVLTGMRPGVMSISIDERDLGGSPVEDALQAVLKGGKSPAFLLRSVLSSVTTYDEGIVLLESTTLSAPVYFAAAGVQPFEGAIITRDRNSLVDNWTLGKGFVSYDYWFLIVTNYDHWLPQPSGDDRMDYGVKYMEDLGQQNVAPGSLFDVLSLNPLLNNHTAHSTVMVPTQDFHLTFIHFTGQ